MYDIHFYKDKRGRTPFADYIRDLSKRTDKDSRIKLNKITDYLQALQVGGVGIGEPHIKHLSGELWELRPLRDRVLFAAWDGDGFILLHHFVKKTQKTPKNEIEQALRNLADIRERGLDDE